MFWSGKVRALHFKRHYGAFFSRWKTGSSSNWNKHFNNMTSLKGREREKPCENFHLQNKVNPPATEIPFYFLYRCQGLNRHPIYYPVNWLIRVDTNRAEICLTYYSQGFFHTLAQSQTFCKVEGRGEGVMGVLFPVFYQQDEYDSLPFLICENQSWNNPRLKTIHQNDTAGKSSSDSGKPLITGNSTLHFQKNVPTRPVVPKL